MDREQIELQLDRIWQTQRWQAAYGGTDGEGKDVIQDTSTGNRWVRKRGEKTRKEIAPPFSSALWHGRELYPS